MSIEEHYHPEKIEVQAQKHWDDNELFSNTPTGSDLQKLSGILTVGGDVYDFAWAPDSSLVAYSADQIADTKIELFVSPPNSNFPNLKVSATTMSGSGVADTGQNFGWSPDSSRLAYVADQVTAGIFELFTATPDGLNNDVVSDIPPLPVVNRDVQDFQWQPNSTHIAYVADQDTDAKNELYVSPKDSNAGNLKVSGSPMIGTGVTEFDWAPDNSRIAYLADQITAAVFELFSATPNGSANDMVSGALVAGGQVQSFKWAPDSSGIGYIADQDINNINELYASQPDGSENTDLSGTLVSGGDVTSFDWVP